MFPFRAKAVAAGGGKDKLKVLAGMSTDGQAPANAPDTTVTFGGLELTIASADFTSKDPGVFFAKNPPSAPGVKKVTVDYVRELVSLSAKGVDLGTIAEGPFDVVLGVDLGGTERTVEVTATRNGKKVRY